MRFFLQAILLFTVLMVEGCVSTAFHAPKGAHYEYLSPAARATQLQLVHSWSSSGAFSVTINGQVSAANFNWQQIDRQRYHINVSSALNLVGFVLIGRPNSVTLWQSSSQSARGASAEALMQQQVGWSLPLSNLYYWVRNLPAPGLFQSPQYDQYGHLLKLEQQGWSIQWRGFVNVARVDLPRLIILSRPNMVIRLVVKQWRLKGINQLARTHNQLEKK